MNRSDDQKSLDCSQWVINRGDIPFGTDVKIFDGIAFLIKNPWFEQYKADFDEIHGKKWIYLSLEIAKLIDPYSQDLTDKTTTGRLVSTREDLQKLLKSYYFPSAESIVLNVFPAYKESIKTSDIFLRKFVQNQPTLFEFLLLDTWQKYGFFTKDDSFAESDIVGAFQEIWDIVTLIEGRSTLNKNQFTCEIYKIKDCCKEILIHKNKNFREIIVSDHRGLGYKIDFLKELSIKSKMQTKNALEGLIADLFCSFGYMLFMDKIISHCHLCGDFFAFQKNKKFCSRRTEGKDCGKQARNQKYYTKKRQKNLQKYRQATKDLRAFYKEKGIKK